MNENTQCYFFTALFAEMNAAKLSYVVLHSWQTLPEEATSDVDILIDEEARKRIEPLIIRVADKVRWRLVQKLWYDVPWCFYYVFVSPNGLCSVALDFISDPTGIGEYRIRDDQILQHRVFSGFLYHLSIEAELAYKLAKRMVKGVFSEKDLIFVNDYYTRSDKSELSRLMQNLLTFEDCVILNRMMEQRMSIADYRDFMSKRSPAFRFLGRRWRIRWRLKWFEKQVERIINRILHPTGCVLVLTINDEEPQLPPFIFRRVVKCQKAGWLARFKALSSATLLVVCGEERSLDVGLGIKTLPEKGIVQFILEEMLTRMRKRR